VKKEKISSLLPEIFQITEKLCDSEKKKSPLTAFLSVMESMHIDSEDILANLDKYFDPSRTKNQFIPFLLKWVDLDWILNNESEKKDNFSLIKTENLRQLVSNAWYLSKWRGSAKGLIMFLETATGVQGFKIDENVYNSNLKEISFHIKVLVPEKAKKLIHIIELIIEKEKPAYVTSEIAII